jgi:GNAT superfamily N-acetyltransferase
MTTVRHMEASELHRIAEIDRSEHITQQYRMGVGGLELIEVDVESLRWLPTGAGEHSVQEKIRSWRPLLERGGRLVGAFNLDEFVGFAIYEPQLSEGVANFAVLHVSKSHRRRGIGRLLLQEVVRCAHADGAERLYVSATPTRGTVDFYRSNGFEMVVTPNEKLFAMEPHDIHMDRAV